MSQSGMSMFGGNTTAAFLQNPQLAMALRQQMLMQPMLSEGTSSEPIRSPWQGLNRIANAGLALLLMKKGEGEAEDAQKQQSSVLAQALQNDNFPPMGGSTAPTTSGPGPQAAAGPGGYGSIIQAAASQHGVPAPLLAAYVQRESGGDPNATNPNSTASGVAQILKSTAENPGYGVPPLPAEDRFSPTKAIPWVANYIGARAKAAGVDWNNPQHVASLMQNVGDGTPQYGQAMAQSLASPGGGGQVGGVNIPDKPPVQTQGMGQPDYMAMAQYKMQQARQNSVIAAQTGNQGVAALAQSQQKEAEMYLQMAANPNSAKSVVRAEQDINQAAAGRPNVTQTVAGNAAEHAAKVGIDQWQGARQTLQANAQTEQQLQVIDALANGTGGFKTGIAPELRGNMQQALATIGLPNTASQFDMLNRAQAILKVGAAKLIQGQGQVTEQERALVGKTVEVMGSQPEAVPLISEAIRSSNEYDRKVFEAYQSSAERNGGVPNLAEVNREIAKIPPPISAKLRNQMEGLVGRSSGGAVPTGAAATSGGYQEGATAVDPNSGQRIILRNGRWVPAQ